MTAAKVLFVDETKENVSFGCDDFQIFNSAENNVKTAYRKMGVFTLYRIGW